MSDDQPRVTFFSPNVFLLNVLVGITFFVINFPKLITNQLAPGIGSAFVRDFVVSFTLIVHEALTKFTGSEAHAFETLMTYSFLGLQLYVALVVIMCVTRANLRPLFFAVLGFIIGVYAVHLIAYLVLAFLWTVQMGIAIFVVISNAIIWFINLLFRDAWVFLVAAGIVVFLYLNRANLLQAIVGLLIVAAVGVALYYLVPPIFAFIVQILLAIADFLQRLFAPILAFLMLLLSPLIALVQWIVEWIIAPVLAFLITAALFIGTFVLAILVILTGFASMGNVVTDQVRSAFRVRRIGTKNHMLNGFALGSALALVLLTSAAAVGIATGVNVGWRQSFALIDGATGLNLQNSAVAAFNPVSIFVSTMPEAVYRFVFKYLTNVQPPLVDAAVLVTLLVLSCVNVTLSIVGLSGAAEVERPITFLPLEVLAIVFWLVFSIASVFVQALTEG
jgi:hypothetical protein